MNNLYIFDLDGTLADISHRRHFVDGQPKNWDKFFAACVEDQPMRPVIHTMLALAAAGNEIQIWSGRSDVVAEQTMKWLEKHCLGGWPIRMRSKNNRTPDHELKLRWLRDMPPEDRARLVAVFEDRTRMVNMWRENGVACFQVAPGDF